MKNETNEVDELIEASPEELKNYLLFLEKELEECVDHINVLVKATSSIFEVFNFIKENIGTSADFPVRIDNDFYNEKFLKLLEKATKDLSKTGCMKENELF